MRANTVTSLCLTAVEKDLRSVRVASGMPGPLQISVAINDSCHATVTQS